MGTNNQLLYYQYSASAKQTKYFNVWRICYLLYINLVQEAVNRRRTEYNGLMKRTRRQAMIHKRLHKKWRNRNPLKIGVIYDASED
jgi:hypothetical protein